LRFACLAIDDHLHGSHLFLRFEKTKRERAQGRVRSLFQLPSPV
jgi:hypothetical protein